MWNLIDRIGYWIATKWTPAWQLRTGVALTLGGLALIPYVFVADEPPVIYLMSAVALVLGGLSVVVTAVLAVHSDPDSDPKDLKP
jgi:peptidoglycan/LPS O-acetylase OafA/YrhL